MARPLRIDVEGGWYCVAARGTERRTLFCDRRHHEHFLELLEEMSARYGLGINAYALMGNHYHLILNSPQANLSAAMQWLNVSFSAWFNAKHERVGHVFQGRFGSQLVDGEGSWLLQASVYLHLNPVRVRALGLDKQSNRVEAGGWGDPSGEEVKKRLAMLRSYQWSSYPAYAGYAKKPRWLQTGTILGRAGGKQKYRNYVRMHVTRGRDPEKYDRLKDQLIVGDGGFVAQMKERVGRVSKEQPDRRFVVRNVSLSDIVAVVEKEKGESWEQFRHRHGDWGRALVLYLARRRSGCTLKELGDWLGGVEYKTVSKTVERFSLRLDHDKKLARITKRCMRHVSNVET